MLQTMTIPLDDDLVQFIDEQVASGQYASASEVAEAGLRLLEARDALRAASIEGEASGGFEDFDADALLVSMRWPAVP